MSLPRRLAPLVVSVLAWTAATTASAQPQKIYRCGPDGRELSQQPCRDAKPAAAAPAAAPAPSPNESDRAAATERARRDAQLAEQMQREREAKEAADARRNAQPVRIGPAAAPPSAASGAAGKKGALKKSD